VPKKGVLSLHYEAEPGTEAFRMRLKMAKEVLGWEFEEDFDVKKWTEEEVQKDVIWRERRQANTEASASGADRGEESNSGEPSAHETSDGRGPGGKNRSGGKLLS
jgi:hypothetical protein